MALDFSKFKFFSRLDARGRMLVLLGCIVGALVAMYFLTKYLSGDTQTTGTSKVANAPSGLQSVPGGQLTPEYYNALVQANKNAAQQAQISGGSAVPTLLNNPNAASPQTGTSSSCNVICSDRSANIKNLLDDWVRQGKVTPEVSSYLQQLAESNVPVATFGQALDQLVKEGKLTPEQARQLLEEYRKQHANRLLEESAAFMDTLIKNGQLPLDVANRLLMAQKNEVTPAEYAALLKRFVRDGSISPVVSQQLLNQYTQQRMKGIIDKSIAILQQMGRDGKITPDILKEIIEMEKKMGPISAFDAALQKYVAAGRLTPIVATSIVDEYKAQKSEIGPTTTIGKLIKAAEDAAFKELTELLAGKQITQETADQIANMINNDVSMDDFVAAIQQLVKDNKLTPELSKLKIEDYRLIRTYRDMRDELANLQANNARPEDFAAALKRYVASGALTPEQAAELMQEYQALNDKSALPVPSNANIAPGPTQPGAESFVQLQQRVEQEGTAGNQIPTSGGESPQDFAVAQAQALQQAQQDQQNRIANLTSAMNGQAQQLVNAWQPVQMLHKEGSAPPTLAGVNNTTAAGATPAAGTTATSTTSSTTTPAVVIKAGTIIFATLDTEVNSDYPSSPVLATVVDGKYKGSKLLGTVVTTKGPSGQLDRVMLNFTLMNNADWLASKSVTAYAIDPDTARSVLASSVDYHYMTRFGAIMATSFLQGYANAIMTSGSTENTGVLVSTTHPELSPGDKLATGLGQVGQTLGSVTQNYVNTPPTVRVAAGVGLGVLFMADLTQ